MQADQAQPSGIILFADRLMRYLGKLEFIAVFLPVILLVADCVLLKRTGIATLPYGLFDTKGYLLAVLVVICVLALIMAEIKPSVMGNDFSVTVNVGLGNISLPSNTTDKLIESYFKKRKSGEKTCLVLVFVGLEMVAMFLYGTLVALTIYKYYLQSTMFG
uniref:Uncharacterized protein n=1 Tax=Dechloromonas aromatica (strain RCB) TaxID=159087 RepID=Q47FK7_DECAR